MDIHGMLVVILVLPQQDLQIGTVCCALQAQSTMLQQGQVL